MSQPPLQPPALTEQSLRDCLRTVIIGKRIELHGQVGSTNDLAREADRQGAAEGLVLVAEEQVAGRGRLGRVWSAPPGCCILCSVLLRPRFAPQHAFYLTIAASLAIYRAAAASFISDAGISRLESKPSVSIKWPNDVLIKGKKVAGILCESEFGGEGWVFAVIGFGINANLDPEQFGALQATATSLSTEIGHPVDRAALLCRVLSELEDLYLSLQNGQFGLIHSEWASALETIGKRVKVRQPDGTLEGYALRVDHEGALVLRLNSGEERRIFAGDVT